MRQVQLVRSRGGNTMECEAADGTVSLYWLPAKFSKVGPAMDGTRTRAVFPSCPLAIAMRAERGRGQAGLAGERTRGSGEEGGTERYFHAPMRAHTHIHAHPLVPQCTHVYVYVAGGLCTH